MGVPSSRPGRGHASASVSTNAKPSTKKFFRSHGFHRDQCEPHPAARSKAPARRPCLMACARSEMRRATRGDTRRPQKCKSSARNSRKTLFEPEEKNLVDQSNLQILPVWLRKRASARTGAIQTHTRTDDCRYLLLRRCPAHQGRGRPQGDRPRRLRRRGAPHQGLRAFQGRDQGTHGRLAFSAIALRRTNARAPRPRFPEPPLTRVLRSTLYRLPFGSTAPTSTPSSASTPAAASPPSSPSTTTRTRSARSSTAAGPCSA